MKNFFILSLSMLFFSSPLEAALTTSQQELETEILWDFVDQNKQENEEDDKHIFFKNKNYISYTSKEMQDYICTSEEMKKMFSDPDLKKFLSPRRMHITIFDQKESAHDDKESTVNAMKNFIKSLFLFNEGYQIKLEEKKFGNFEAIDLGFEISDNQKAHISIFSRSEQRKLEEKLEKMWKSQKDTTLSEKEIKEKEKEKEKLDKNCEDLTAAKEKIEEKLQDNDSRGKLVSAIKGEFLKKFCDFFFEKMLSKLEDLDILKLYISDSQFANSKDSFKTFASFYDVEGSPIASHSAKREFFKNIFDINEKLKEKADSLTDRKELQELQKETKQYIELLNDFNDIFFDILPEDILAQNQKDELYEFSKAMRKVEKTTNDLEKALEHKEKNLAKPQESNKDVVQLKKAKSSSLTEFSSLLKEADKDISSALIRRKSHK